MDKAWLRKGSGCSPASLRRACWRGRSRRVGRGRDRDGDSRSVPERPSTRTARHACGTVTSSRHRFAGRLLRIDLKVGDTVVPGTLLARLAPAAPVPLDARAGAEYRERLGTAEAAPAEQAPTSSERPSRSPRRRRRKRARRARAPGLHLARRRSDNAQREVELRIKEPRPREFDAQAAHHRSASARARSSRSGRAAVAGTGRRWEIRSPVSGRVFGSYRRARRSWRRARRWWRSAIRGTSRSSSMC